MTAPDIRPLGQKQRKPKKPPRRNWGEQADTVFSRLVRRPGVCAIEGCGKTRDLQCAHGFSRRYHAVRWDFRNAFCLDRGCHVKYTHNPILWDDWLRATWGDDLYAEMRTLALYGSSPDLKALLAELKELEKAA